MGLVVGAIVVDVVTAGELVDLTVIVTPVVVLFVVSDFVFDVVVAGAVLKVVEDVEELGLHPFTVYPLEPEITT